MEAAPNQHACDFKRYTAVQKTGPSAVQVTQVKSSWPEEPIMNSHEHAGQELGRENPILNKALPCSAFFPVKLCASKAIPVE